RCAVRCPFTVFFFGGAATTGPYTLSLHDALPISIGAQWRAVPIGKSEATIEIQTSAGERLSVKLPLENPSLRPPRGFEGFDRCRSEEHTSELQSRENPVCRLLLEKKKIPIATEDP